MGACLRSGKNLVIAQDGGTLYVALVFSLVG
jgi:hypothetical protein